MGLNLDPKHSLPKPSVPLSSQGAMLVGVGYDGKERMCAFLKFYDPATRQIHFWYDNTKHLPYCLSKESMEWVRTRLGNMSVDLRQSKRFDALLGEEIPVTEIYASNPLEIANVRDFVDVNEANIRYVDCYVHDRRLEPGMFYSVHMGKLVLSNFAPPLPEVLQQSDPRCQKMVEQYFRLMEAPVPEFRRIAVDIEVYCPIANRVSDPAEAENQITACSLASNDGVKKVLLLRRDAEADDCIWKESGGQFEGVFFDREEALIAEIFRYLVEYPFVLTFNGDEFDFRYLYNRAVRLGFQPWQIPIEYHRNFMGLKLGIHIDLFRFFFNRGLQSYCFDSKYKANDLDSVAQGLLGEGKLPHENIGKMSYVELASYGFQDAKLTLGLTTYDGNMVMKLITACSRITSQSFEDVTREGISGFFRSMLTREHRIQGYIIPRPGNPDLGITSEIAEKKGVISTKSGTKGKKFKGAEVITPVPGMHYGVSVLDVGCLDGETVVEGKQLRKVLVGDTVNGQTVTDVRVFKDSERFELRLSNDSTIIASPDHRFVGRHGRLRRVRDMRTTDLIAVDWNSPFRNKLAVLCGIIHAEGGWIIDRRVSYFDKSRDTIHNTRHYRLTITIDERETEMLALIEEVLRGQGIFYYFKPKRQNHGLEIQVSRKEDVLWLWKFYNRYVVSSDRLISRSFLAGFFEGDGHVNTGRNTVEACQNKLWHRKIVLQKLALVGFYPRLHVFQNTSKLAGTTMDTRILLSPNQSQRFMQEIGLVSKKKSRRFLAKVVSRKKLSRGTVFDISLSGNHLYYANGVLSHNSLYPTIFYNYNIGYETIRCVHEECHVNKIPFTEHWFCGKKISMESLMIGAVKDLRIKWYKDKAKKSEDSFAKAIVGMMKAMSVAAFGVFGSETFPYYCPSAAESVTAIGRSTIIRITEKAKELGFEVMYGDTDSVFVIDSEDK